MSERARHAWVGLLVVAVTAVGFWFRWRYAHDVSFFVDEYLHLRAAGRILAQGIPLLPSGNYYSHGQLVSYLVAPLVAAGVTAPWLLRLPMVMVSTAAIPLAYWTGRRIFRGGPAAGLLAAALLAFAPEAILWGGRLRMYATLQFFVQVTVLVFYRWVVEEQDRPVYRVLFVVAFWGALFSHAEAMILLPLWAVWALAQRGWRWCLRPANLLTFGLAGLSVAIEIGLRRIGPPVQAWIGPGLFQPVGRDYLGGAPDWAGITKVIEPLFLAPARWPLTVLVGGGLIALAVAWLLSRRRGAAMGSGSADRRGLAYLTWLLLPPLAVLLFAADPEWQSPRYGLMLLPVFFLVAGGVAALAGRWVWAAIRRAITGRATTELSCPSGRNQSTIMAGNGATDGRRCAGHRVATTSGQSRVTGRPYREWVGRMALAAAVALIAVTWWPGALAATRETVPAYDWGFAYVEEQQQPGDVVITFLCQAAFFHLGRCDYLAIPTDYQGFAFQKGGQWVSGWDEVPIVDSAEGLRQVLAGAPGVWFVIDEGRFRSRYAPEFVQAVVEGMELVAAEGEVLVFHAPKVGP